MACTYDGKEYSEGSLICANGRELVCDAGAWRENGYFCDMRGADGSRQQIDVSLAEPVPRADPTSATVSFVKGCMIVLAASGGFRLYNSCNECKIAVLFMTDNQMKQSRKEVKVESKGDVFVDMRGYYKADYIDDLECPK